jgi:fatty acid/phospholipid biosynthesis enzyme
MPIRIAVDAMGGDRAPGAVIQGAVRALQRASHEVELLLFGPEERLRQALDEHADYVADELLATSVRLEPGTEETDAANIDVDGTHVAVVLRKAAEEA